MAQTTLVKIKRSEFGSKFQLVRAMLSAASALIISDRKEAAKYIDKAIVELEELAIDIRVAK